MAVVAAGFGAGVARADVAPTEDNPPGCQPVQFGSQSPECGAQGRNPYFNAKHMPPIDACNNVRGARGSLVTRVLPDGPRRADGTPAFITGACVYLPPGYESGALRYPTLYLLHGGGGDEGDWVVFGGIQKMLDDAYAADPSRAVIVVMPDGDDGNWHDYADGSFMNEQYVLHYLLPYIDSRFRTIPRREGRAIDGLSNGGYGALLLAAKAPDEFIAAGGMSSNVGARTLDGLGPEDSAFHQGNVPVSLAPNLDGVNVTMDIGSHCSSPDDLSQNLCIPLAVDALFIPDNEAFRDAMRAQHHVGAFEYRETEGEHSWRWWTFWLRERHLPFMWPLLSDPQPTDAPVDATASDAFRYRSVSPRFALYGYSFDVTRPNLEFLDVSLAGGKLTLTGSGTVVVTTPDGRHLNVDLNAAHFAKTVDVTPQSRRPRWPGRCWRSRSHSGLGSGPAFLARKYSIGGTQCPRLR